MRTFTFHVRHSHRSLITLDRSDAPSLAHHVAYTCDLSTDAQAIATASTFACPVLITRDVDRDDFARSFGNTTLHRVSSRFDVASRTLTFHRDKLGFEIAYQIGVDSATNSVP